MMITTSKPHTRNFGRMMTMSDFYEVYDNTTDKIVCCGMWEEVSDYAECEGRYAIIKMEIVENEEK